MSLGGKYKKAEEKKGKLKEKGRKRREKRKWEGKGKINAKIGEKKIGVGK
jgi:hypothetical protein